MYSVENYLVTDEVLESLLRDEFPCHAMPELREFIAEVFRRDYDHFLGVTSDLNRRIYYARKLSVEITGRLPTALRDVAVVDIGKIAKSITPVEDAVVLVRLRWTPVVRQPEPSSKV